MGNACRLSGSGEIFYRSVGIRYIPIADVITIRANIVRTVVDVDAEVRRAFITKNIGIPMIEYTYMKF